MKIAIAGKGGVGKTTLTGLLARTLAGQGYRVLAIDADPDANLASALPLDDERKITPLAARADLVDALSGRGALPGGMIQLNPDIGAILPEFRQSWGGGQSLLTLGWHKGGGQGCYCAENAVLKRVLASVIPRATDVVLVDAEAGLEHLSRGTAAAVDAVLVGDRSDQDLDAVQAALGAWPILAHLPWADSIRRADLDDRPPEIPESFRPELKRLVLSLISFCPMTGVA